MLGELGPKEVEGGSEEGEKHCRGGYESEQTVGQSDSPPTDHPLERPNVEAAWEHGQEEDAEGGERVGHAVKLVRCSDGIRGLVVLDTLPAQCCRPDAAGTSGLTHNLDS